MELYIHIPFCVRKCLYCDFLSFPCMAGEKTDYLEALHQEILCCGRGREDGLVTSVFVGGGTPSLLTGDEMERLFGTLRQQFVFAEDAEITMEANPGTLTEEGPGSTGSVSAVSRCTMRNWKNWGGSTDLQIFARVFLLQEKRDSPTLM